MSDTKQLEIPAGHIPDFGAVADEIGELYKQFPEGGDERTLALAGIMDRVRAGEDAESAVPLSELALDTVTNPDLPDGGTALRRALFNGSQPSSDSLQVDVAQDDGRITDARVVRRIPEDKAATARGHKIVAATPAGPKPNNTSFRGNVVDPKYRN